MKRIILLTALFLTLGSFVHSQSYHKFLNDTLYWDIAFAEMGYICGAYSDYPPRRVALSGDTMINNTLYSIFIGYPMYPVQHPAPPNCPPFYIDTISDGIVWGLMREDTITQKVYLYDPDDEIEMLWYDFKAQPGDTLEYPWYGDFIVDTIYDIVTYDGVSRKYFEGIGWSNFFIEGLGGVSGPFYEPHHYFESGPWLMCIKGHQGQSIWGYDCYDFTTSVPSLTEKEVIRFFPNPARNTILIESIKGVKIEYISLINLQGQTIKIFDAEAKQLDVSNINPGVYFIRIATETKVWSEKVIIKK